MKDKKFPPEPLTPAEARALVLAPSRRAPTGIRNRALIVLLYRAGLRISEALALYPKDLDMNGGTVRVCHGKGDRSRTVGLDPGAWAILESWMVKRAELNFNGVHPVFCTLDGKRVLASYVRGMLPRMAKRAGIEKRVHAHGLRHTLAFELAQEGVPTHLIQAQLGHASLAVTDRYVRHIAPVAVIQAMQGREW